MNNPIGFDKLKTNRLSINSIREESSLTLRKQSIQSFLLQKKITSAIEHNILEFSLVNLNIPDDIKYYFRLKEDNLSVTLPQTIEYLHSNQSDYVKLAAFIFKRYFENFIKSNSKTDLKPFISSSILDHIGNVLKTITDLIVVSELLNGIFYITNFDCYPDKNYTSYEYYLRLTMPDYIEGYKRCLLEYNNKGEIAELVINILFNLIYEREECLQDIVKSGVVGIVLDIVILPSTSFNVFTEGSRLLSLLAKNSLIVSDEQKLKLFNFFNSILTDASSNEIIGSCMIGLNNLSTSNQPFLHLYLTKGTIQKIMLLDMEEKEEYQQLIVANYLDIFVNLSHHLPIEKIREMLNDNSVLNFIEANLLTVSKHQLKMKCLYFAHNISSQGIDEVNSLLSHNIFPGIIALLNHPDFKTRKICVLIIKNCLSLNDYEIAMQVYKLKALEKIIKNLLTLEKDEEMQLQCIKTLIAFLSCGHNIASSNPLKEIMLKDNIEGVMTSFSISSDEIENAIKKLQIELSS